MTSIIHANYLRPSISKSIHNINANRFQMFGIIIDVAPNGEKNKVLVSSNVKLLQLFQRIQPSVYFIIISDERWRKKWQKRKVSLTQLKKYPGTCIKTKASYTFLKTYELYHWKTTFCNLEFPVLTT